MKFYIGNHKRCSRSSYMVRRIYNFMKNHFYSTPNDYGGVFKWCKIYLGHHEQHGFGIFFNSEDKVFMFYPLRRNGFFVIEAVEVNNDIWVYCTMIHEKVKQLLWKLNYDGLENAFSEFLDVRFSTDVYATEIIRYPFANQHEIIRRNYFVNT